MSPFRSSSFLCVSLVALHVSLSALPAAPSVTTSASGQYRVTGADSLQVTGYTRWAEDMAAQLRRVTGLPLAAGDGAVVEIMLVDALEGNGAISVSCTRQGGILKRVLSIRSTGQVDEDLLQEGFVRLALAGIVERRRREEGLPGVVPVIPGWLSTGLAGILDPGRLAINRRIVSGTGSELAAVPVSSVLGWEQFPEGWHGRQALCGLVAAWILSVPEAMDRVLERVVLQLPVSPEWLAKEGVRADSVKGLEDLWQAWRRKIDRTILEFGGLSLALIEELKDELPLEIKVPRRSPLVDADLRAASELDKGATSTDRARRSRSTSEDPFETIRLEPAQVTEARKTWPEVVARAASRKMEGLGLSVMGKAPELVEVATSYGAFYEAVARGSWPMVQRWRLNRADKALQALERLTREREAYLDEVEWEAAGKGLPGGSEAGAVLGAELEKSRMESYIDDVERKHLP